MGAGSRQRGDKSIRQVISDESTEITNINREYLSRLYADISRNEKALENAKYQIKTIQEDLRRANALIDRLRAEANVLKDEKKKFISIVDETKRLISVSGNCHKKWAVTLVKSRLEKAGLI